MITSEPEPVHLTDPRSHGRRMLEFTAPVGSEQLVAGVALSVGARRSPYTDAPSLRVSSISGEHIRFVYGSRSRHLMSAALVVEAADVDYCEGGFHVTSWTGEMDGHLETLERLFTLVAAGIVGQGGTVTEV